MYFSFLFQPSTIFNRNTVPINFSQLSQSDPIASESFHSSSEPNGNTPHGPKSHSPSSQKTRKTSKPDTTKSTLEPWPDAFQARIFMSFFHSEPTSREPSRPKLSCMASKSPQIKSLEATHPSKSKSLTHKSTQPVSPSVSPSQQ